MSHLSAETIYQTHLDAVTKAFWQRDWDAMIPHLALPAALKTKDAHILITSKDDLILAQIDARDSLTRLGATAYHRLCKSAEFTDDSGTSILGRHTTYVLRSGSYALEPYESEMALVRQPGGWQARGFSAKTLNRDYTLISPSVAGACRASFQTTADDPCLK